MMRRTRVLLSGALGLLTLTAWAPAQAQGIAAKVARAPDGVVRMWFPARAGVCGDGDGIAVREPGREGASFVRWSFRDGDRDRESRCRPGPVRVELGIRGGEVREVKTFVGEGAERGAHDLGAVSAGEAVQYLLGLAARAPERVGKDAVLPTILAEGVEVRPELLRLAGDEGVPEGTRETAVFWAAERGAALAELTRLYARVSNSDVKEKVIFAYSRRKEPEAVRELLRIARSEREPVALRKKAVFWLGQAAGREVARELGGIVEESGGEMQVKEHAIFALSRRPRDEAVPALIRIARENPSPRLRKKAIFWLGETGDPRAVAFFEEILGRS